MRAEKKRLRRVPNGHDLDKASIENRTASKKYFSKVFGSIPKALLAAGIKSNGKEKFGGYTKAQLIKQIKSMAKKLRRVPQGPDFDRLSKKTGKVASSKTFRNKFGSFYKALAAAGIKGRRRRTKYTIAQLKKQLKSESKRLGHFPTAEDLQKSYDAERTAGIGLVLARFGSLKKAAKAVGWKPNTRWTRSKLGKCNLKVTQVIKQSQRSLKRNMTKTFLV